MIINNPFINHFTDRLPADQIKQNNVRQVKNAAFSYVEPTKVSSPQLISHESELLTSLNLNLDIKTLTQIVSGNHLFAGMKPYAMCYGGHQFGQWAEQLGDGRAINLGEVIDQQGQLKTLQLKGAGLTPYSRSADGLAVLRSSVREFLCSEAMYHLGVPTTRALSLSLSGENVLRDMFYDGNAEYEPGAIVCRVSSSFLRFGSFQLPHYRSDTELLKQLADYCISNHFPHLGEPSMEVYLKWFEEICQKTCDLIVHWMRVGFVHGVMNTDNMSILSETIDYGPYGWIDNYDLNWTPNTTDRQFKRYKFGSQGAISQWNLYQLANALYPLIQQVEPLQAIIDNYADLYTQKYHEMMLAKLGLSVQSQQKKEAMKT